jgi:hypothetical protein
MRYESPVRQIVASQPHNPKATVAMSSLRTNVHQPDPWREKMEILILRGLKHVENDLRALEMDIWRKIADNE